MRLILLITVSLFFNPSFAKSRVKTAAQLLEEQATDKSMLVSTAPPKDNESCFSPDEPCVYKLIHFILSAKASLEIAIFDITDMRVAKAIVEQTKKVKVRMIINKRTRDTTGAYKLLKDAHILIRVGKQRGIMHDKITIVDGKRLELGSYNYSYGAARSNQENQLYLSTPSVVERYKQRFEKMWREGKTR